MKWHLSESITLEKILCSNLVKGKFLNGDWNNYSVENADAIKNGIQVENEQYTFAQPIFIHQLTKNRLSLLIYICINAFLKYEKSTEGSPAIMEYRRYFEIKGSQNIHQTNNVILLFNNIQIHILEE